MLSINKQEDPVFQFLAGTFHQDIESPDATRVISRGK
ncbi:contact-dependent growth inhibition system immunity protein [Bacillus stercoris]